MPAIHINGKTYIVDENGFLLDTNQWDQKFAENLAPHLSIPGGLTSKHWEVIHFIRNWYMQKGTCPLVYQTCKMNQLRINALRELFPTGYLRGACKLAGLTYKYAYHGNTGKLSGLSEKAAEIAPGTEERQATTIPEKYYEVDVCGFLVDPDNWDEAYAIHKAYELKIPEILTEKHWEIIYFLRNQFALHGRVPTVFDTCLYFQMEIDDLARLFPDGYHRGAVKIAGLRV